MTSSATMTSSARRPDLRQERALLRAGARVVVGIDEVGRGALAGPVSVGAVVVDLSTRPCPPGLADSKLLTPAAREALVPLTQRWCLSWGVGHAGPAEIDAYGIIAALRLAGRRALAQIRRSFGDVDTVLLDGNHDWLSGAGIVDLFEADESGADGHCAEPQVTTMVKADMRCASVAAASVLAKCERDGLMQEFALQYPEYGWAQNKGYGAAVHLDALRTHGPTPLHRRSWRLPTPVTTSAQHEDGPAASLDLDLFGGVALDALEPVEEKVSRDAACVFEHDSSDQALLADAVTS